MHLVWLRNDLRLEDNPALYHASTQGNVCCAYVVTALQWQTHNDAPAKIAFWRARLIALSAELTALNIPLRILAAPTYNDIPHALFTLAHDIQAHSLQFNNEYPFNEKHRDQQTTEHFENKDIPVHRFDGDIIIPSDRIRTLQNTTYKVFTPFSRQWHKQLIEQDLNVLPAPTQQNSIMLASDVIEAIPLSIWGIEENHVYREDLWPTHSNDIHHRLTQFLLSFRESI